MGEKKTKSTSAKKSRKDVKLARQALKSRIALLGRQLRGKQAQKLDAGQFDKLYNELQKRTSELARLR